MLVSHILCVAITPWLTLADKRWRGLAVSPACDRVAHLFDVSLFASSRLQENLSLIAELKQLRTDAKSLKQQRAAVKVIADRALAKGPQGASAPSPPLLTNIDDVIEQQKVELGSLKVPPHVCCAL